MHLYASFKKVILYAYLLVFTFFGLLISSETVKAGDARHATAVRITENIQIDGILDEPIWKEVPDIGEFVQNQPDSGAPPTYSTEIKVAYNDDTLYIAIKCFDDSVDKLIATQMARDSSMSSMSLIGGGSSDDHISILIDTFNDGRNAYYFQTNPIGLMVDGQVTDNFLPDRDWDGIWYVKSQIVDDGWSAEFEIPFKTLSFDPKSNTWGFNAERFIGRIRESSRWASPSLDILFYQVTAAGAIDGLKGLSQGLGLDIKTYGVGGLVRDINLKDRTSYDADAGVDIFYRITSNLVSSTTINTDFAETEADTRQMNLTRFSIFFPEKRTFFLEDEGFFQFTSEGGSIGGGMSNLALFFSRKIGIVSETPVPIQVGQKVTGRVGRFTIGLLDVLTDEAEVPNNGPEPGTRIVPSQNLMVGRVKANFFQQSYIGALMTYGDPEGLKNNSLVAFDMSLGTMNFLNRGKNLSLSMNIAKTKTTNVTGKDKTYGITLAYPNDLIYGRIEWQDIGENFNPALGYVRRGGIQSLGSMVKIGLRPDKWNIRQWRFGIMFNHYYNKIQDSLESQKIRLDLLELEFNNGSRFSYNISRNFERLFNPFEIHPGVSIPIGDYTFHSHNLSFHSSSTKTFRWEVSYETGSFYNGNNKELSTEVSWRNRNINTSFELQQYWVKLIEGDFTERLALLTFNYSFNPLITLMNLAQYDTNSRNLGLQSRLRWTVKPGNDVFVVLNHSWERNPLGRLDSLHTDLRAKITYTVRF